MFKITPIAIRTAALATFVSSLAFAIPLYAATGDTYGANQNNTDQASPDQADAGPQANAQPTPRKMHGAVNVENRIKTLHDKLKITDAQENDWSQVAQIMRDNEANIHQLIQARHQNPSNMTAIEDLQSYQQITQAHADGLQKLIPAFQTLYNDMSDRQKKNADEVFGRFEGYRGNAPAKKQHS